MVPRSFLGALVVSAVSAPLVALANTFDYSKLASQYIGIVVVIQLRYYAVYFNDLFGSSAMCSSLPGPLAPAAHQEEIARVARRRHGLLVRPGNRVAISFPLLP